MDVEDVLTTEGVRVGVVLVGAEAPFGVAGHRVGGDLAQETYLFSLDVDSADEGVEVGRIAKGVCLDLEGSFIGSVLVFVDGGPHFPEVAAEFALLLALDLKARDGDSDPRQNSDDGYRDDEFDECEAGLWICRVSRTRLSKSA